MQVDTSEWETHCHCGAELEWQPSPRVLRLDTVDRYTYHPVCTDNCRGYERAKETGARSHKVDVPK